MIQKKVAGAAVVSGHVALTGAARWSQTKTEKEQATLETAVEKLRAAHAESEAEVCSNARAATRTHADALRRRTCSLRNLAVCGRKQRSRCVRGHVCSLAVL